MGKGIKEWTDIDYAQAAIDMLPGTVEEIEVFLRAQKIKGRPNSAIACPIANWVSRWMGVMASVGWCKAGPANSEVRVSLPKPVTDFILAVDRKDIQL